MFGYTFFLSLVWDKLPELLEGAKLTLEITILSMIVGTAIAPPLALMRRQGSGPGYRFATVWVELARNTPALFQIYMGYFGLGAFGLQLSSFLATFIALSFNNAGYLEETPWTILPKGWNRPGLSWTRR